MLQSQLFAKIKKTAPKEAEFISHKYLLRGDFIEQSFSGVYRLLPLGFKVFKKIEDIIREEMLNLGAQELYLPVLQNKNLWLETNRWQTFDPPLFKLKDRHQKETALGPTHEEEITDTFRKRIKSYQDLPLYLFQIQNKFRNEMRATGGLFRTREFIMKDLYSFHTDERDLADFYEKVKKAYFRIYQRCGLNPLCVEASSGTIGGDFSHEFMVLSPVGEDKILVCKKCKSAANVEKIGSIKNCRKCKSALEEKSCIEIGHIFNLGTKYSKIMKAEYLDKSGKAKPAIMGCYGIGLQRLMAAVVETNCDKSGIIWPKEVAPFAIHLIQIGDDQNVRKVAEKIYQDLQKSGKEVLYDDREKSPGEKFAEADLIGIPLRMVVSPRTLAEDSVEIKKREESQIKLVKINQIKNYVE
ncbi:MAG: proline--tRNA ligase [Candidatus Pacebacteria bacterium]|nr:proline--tRNA ligase [Candidatus Paceibacterota bacterium]